MSVNRHHSPRLQGVEHPLGAVGRRIHQVHVHPKRINPFARAISPSTPELSPSILPIPLHIPPTTIISPRSLRSSIPHPPSLLPTHPWCRIKACCRAIIIPSPTLPSFYYMSMSTRILLPPKSLQVLELLLSFRPRPKAAWRNLTHSAPPNTLRANDNTSS